MGAFLSLMSGMAKGANDYSLQVEKEKRDEELKQRTAIHDSIMHRIENDDTLNHEQRMGLFDTAMKSAKMNPKIAEALKQHITGVSQLHDALKAKQGSPGGSAAAVPSANPSGGLPPMPTPPPGLGGDGEATSGGDEEQAPTPSPAPVDPGVKASAQEAGNQVAQVATQSPEAQSSFAPMPQQKAYEGSDYNGAYKLREAYSRAKISEDQRIRGTEATAAGAERRVRAQAEAQNQEKLKRVQATMKMIQEQNGEDTSRPVHMKLSPNGEPILDEGRTHVPIASGSDINEDVEFRGGPKIDKTGSSFYKGTRFGNAVEWQKIPGIKNRIVIPDSASPTGFSSAAVMAGGAVSQDPELRSPVAPPASQTTKQTTGGTWKTDPATGQNTWYPTQSTSGPKTPVGAVPPTQTTGGGFSPLPTAPGNDFTSPGAPPAPPPPPKQTVTPEIAALADVLQNDLTTGKAMLANYPPRSPIRIAVQNEVNRRMAIGQGPTPVFLGTTARNQVQQAKLMAPEINMTAKDVDRLSNKLGPIMGRWNEFLAGTVGSGDPEFQKLRSDLSLIKGKVSQIHFGSQSGVQAVERFDKIMSADRMDAPTLLAGLSSLSQILKLYGSLNVTSGAAMAEGGANSRATPSSSIPGSPIPKPSSPGQKLDSDTAQKYMGMAGGDKNKARQLAKQDGWAF